MPRQYSTEFRERALELVRSGGTVVDVPAMLGIAQLCLYRWKQQDLIGRGMNKDEPPGLARGIHVDRAYALEEAESRATILH